MNLRRLVHRIFNRFTVIVILVALQGFIFAQILLHWSNFYVQISEALKVISILAVYYLIYKQENPSIKLAWIVPILLFPIIGGVVFIAFGHVKIPRRMRSNMMLTSDAADKAHWEDWKQEKDVMADIPVKICNEVRYISRYDHTPCWDDTATEYFSDGIPYWESLLGDLERAEDFIFLEYFIIGAGEMWDRVLEILRRKADEGVDIRVIYDDVGSIFVLPNHYDRTLEKMGIRCVNFNKLVPLMHVLMNNRDHRKIAVIDGKTAYTGGINISDEYINKKERFGYWKDAGIRLEGDAVWNFTVMFLQMWNTCRMTESDFLHFKRSVLPHKGGGLVQPFGDSPLDDENLGETVYLNVINSSERYLYIFTPYLITDNEMLTALRCAAKRGVDVRIVTPGTPDKKIVYLQTQANYPSLINAGVKIMQYNRGFIHSKCMLSDDDTAVIGTINLDYRSLYHHFECGVFLYKTQAGVQLKADMENTFAQSDLITMQFFAKKRFRRHILLPFVKLFSPLL